MPKELFHMKCKYLEHQVCVRTDGQYRLCCVSQEPDNIENVNTHSIIEWHNSKTVRDAKNQLDKGFFPPSCTKCMIQESKGLESQRTKPEQYGPGISHLDLRFGNSCNLACVMCFPGSSSTLDVEHRKLLSMGIDSPWGDKIYNNTNWYTDELADTFSNLKDLREVYLTGGEPMMVRNLCKFLSKLDSSVRVRFNTNGTILNPQVLTELKRFEHVSMTYSIDGIGKVNDYIRWGSRWEDIERNVMTMAELPNVDVSISPTVQILNLINYDELIVWCQRHGFTRYDNILSFPVHYSIKHAHRRLQAMQPLFSEWYLSEPDPMPMTVFRNFTRILDNSRNTNISHYLPAIADIYELT